MTETNRPAAAVTAGEDEPDLLRDQFRQLTRYRRILLGGIGVGLVGGAWLGITSADTYVASSDVVLRAPALNPFDANGSSPDKLINIGSERQAALGNEVAKNAAKDLGVADDELGALRRGLQVTNPPQTLVLRFTYTASSPQQAAKRANAMTEAYLKNRQAAYEAQRDNMVKAKKRQVAPIAERIEDLNKEISRTPDGPGRDTLYTQKAEAASTKGSIDGDIQKLGSLDMSPGRITNTATPPKAPDGPGLIMSLLIGGAVGLAIGLLAAWVRLVFDPAPRSDGDVARALRAPVLGNLPRDRTGGGPLLAAGEADPRLAEEYRSVAFRLAYDARFADRRRLLVVAPRGSSETAAAVAVNLAASFAETGKDVLMIEADLRTPVLASQLRTDTGARPRWSSQMSGAAETEWPDGRQLVVDAGESGSFDLIPGERVRNVARALTSQRASRLISEADSPNSTVVVLAPPVLSYADALALVDRVDGVLVVCAPRAVHRTDLVRIRELISGAGGTVLGAVLHSALPADKKGGRKGGKGAGRRPEPAPAAAAPPRRQHVPPPSAADREREQVRDAERVPDPTQHIPGDGSDTVALRMVRPGER
ncbi:lipopolysaccharide biosynthesis protein [Streptomyces sp. NPDC101118]|uniref:lipopolysaccharide biosynthesis protein n=1 Tax=Streptomyces sp. NPDC101118 TaxID=3366109 RepID=UPI00382707B7